MVGHPGQAHLEKVSRRRADAHYLLVAARSYWGSAPPPAAKLPEPPPSPSLRSLPSLLIPALIKLCDAICLVNHGRAVLQGGLREIKSSYGSRFVQIAYDGDGKFLSRCALVESSNNYGNYAEVKLRPGADSQQLLRAAMCAARISRFEVMEPSLEQIFIDRVEKANV